MKHFVVFLFAVLSATISEGQSSLEAHMKSQQRTFTAHQSLQKSTAGDNYDIIYHRIHWNINPYSDTLYGTVTSYFRTRRDNFAAIAFDLADNMNIDSVSYHGNQPLYNHNADIITIDLPTVLGKGILDSITVHYHGNPVSAEGYYSREKRRPKNDHPVVWTLSQPYGAMKWWPCKQTLSDKIDSLDIFVTVPQGDKAASNGVLVDTTLNDTFVTFHWKHRYPIVTYLVAVAVTNYSEFSDWVYFDNGDSLEILNYLYPESVPSMREPAKVTVDMMHLFDSIFGPYPFMEEKYGHAQFGRSGGMEHQTMSFMSDLNFSLVAHELAHQWFGDATTCRTWSDLWLNEGFATFLTLMSFEGLKSKEEYRAWAKRMLESAISETDGSVFVQDTLDIRRLFSGRLSYNKGALLLQMLRFKLGDDVFYRALRNYLNDEDHVYGFARTEDLIFFLEQESGEDLTDFFDQWFYSEGFPNIDVRWKPIGDAIELSVSQTPSHPSVEFFEIPVPLYFSNGNEDTTVVIDPTSDQFTTVIDLDFAPDTLIFDPDYRIIAKSSVFKVQEDLNKFTVYPNPVVDQLNVAFVPFKIEEFVIYDMAGKEVLRENVVTKGNNYGTLDVSGLMNGFYQITCIGEDKSSTSRFLKR